MSNPRDILRKADSLRSQAKTAQTAVDLMTARTPYSMNPAVGTLTLSGEAKQAIVDALIAKVHEWTTEASELEATVVVAR